jgi:hypothetical protein
VSIAEPRTTGGRRRRRLAVAGEQGAAETTDGPGGLARLRDRLGDLPALSPWLPRQLWKRVVLGSLYGLTLVVVGLLLVQLIEWPAAIAPIASHLVGGSRPALTVFATTALWFAAGQFAALIGWYRSHSENDFHGRYRIWAILTAAFAGASFLAGTDVHLPIAQAVLPYWKWPIWRPEVTTWLVPLATIGLFLAWRMDRDLRRCLAGLWLARLALMTMLATAGGELFASELSSKAWYPAAMTLAPVLGPGLLVLGLWLQACFVAYVCADPPEPPAITWQRRLLNLLIGLVLLPFSGSAEPQPDAKPTRRRKKAVEEDGEAAPKRRRKTAAKSRRTSKPRTRTKPEDDVEEEGAEEEASEEESWEEGWDETTAESSDTDTEDWQAEEEASRPDPPAKKSASAPAPTPVPPDDESDDEGESYRLDGGQENAELFKGLSKRQRRELKKQLRDQQRNR